MTSTLRHAATDPALSAWAEANAGSGKTRLLTHRVLRLLLAGVAPSRILCLTYTRAAAAEMLERVQKTAAQWAAAHEDKLREELEKLSGTPPSGEMLSQARALFATLVDAPAGLQIQTIHAFCQSVLRRFPLEAGIASFFRVLDERTSGELLREAVQKLYAKAGEGEPGVAEALALLAARRSEGSIFALLSELAAGRRHLSALFARYGNAAECSRILHERLGSTPDDAETPPNDAERDTLMHIADILGAAGGKTNLATAAALRGDVEVYLRGFLTKEGEPRRTLFTKNTLTDSTLIEALIAAQARAHAFFKRRETRALAEGSAALLTLAEALLAEYDALKSARALLDYDDLVLAAIRLLEQPGIAPWVMYKLDGGIDHVLIDEAQDTSPEQWRIVSALTQEYFAGEGRSDNIRTVFAVGDPKQSIFSFQGADPAAFTAIYAHMASAAEAAGARWVNAALPESFRSTAPVLRAVDAAFPSAQGHTLTRGGEAGRVECWPLTAAESLPGLLADTIAGWVEAGTPPGDVMILVRRRGAMMEALIRALKRRGVPVAGIDRMALAENLAVQDLLALGAFLLLPEDDLNLAALLKSPLCGVGEEELFALAHGREDSLWARVQAADGAAHTFLAALLARTNYLAPYELFSYALGELGGRARLTGRMGMEYDDAIQEFLSQTLAFEQLHPPSLQGLLHWMTQGGTEVKRDMESGAGGFVRIMTVHGAKGLQAKAVILADTTGLPPGGGDSLLWMAAEKGAFPLWAAGGKAEAATRLREERRAAEMAEYRRLLYVAMTRAEDRLILCGAAGARQPPAESWHPVVWAALEGIAGHVETPAGAGLLLECAQEKPLAARVEVTPLAAPPMPDSLLRPPPPERVVRTLTPSRLADETLPAASPREAERYRRGVLLHRLLQHLPDVPDAAREKAAHTLLAAHADVPESARADMIREALAVLRHPEFAPYFAPGSLAEVPVAGKVYINGEETPVSGQIDRLAITEEAVWILDYKTDTTLPQTPTEIPRAYLRQMEAYHALIQAIYPGRAVRCALLWTAGPRVMEVIL